jgi:hypothetical protein
MKRLDRTYRRRLIVLRRSGLPAVDEQGWLAYADRLRRVSVNPGRVRAILQQATLDRMMFEDGLEAIVTNRGDTAYVNRLRRELRAADRARKLIAFLQERSWFFGSTADKLDARLRKYRRFVRVRISSDRLSPRGRRAEVWAERAVAEIARLYRERRLPWNRAVADAHAGLTLFKHEDVISREQVRHMIRRARAGGPKRGKRS